MNKMQIIVNGILVCYEVHGKGKVIVLLHGWGDKASGLHVLSDGLFRQYSVVSLDLPGFGGSELPPDNWGLNEYAELVRAFLDKIGLQDVWAIIGHSNGGAIAIRGLSKDFLHAERLVLLASAGIRGVHGNRNHMLSIVAKTGKILAKPLPKKTQKQLRAKLYKSIGSDLLVAEQLQESFKRIVKDDVRADAAKLQLPTLLLYGENDKETPLSYGETYHEILSNSVLEVLPGAGHYIFNDRPTEVLKIIEGFLE